VHSDRSLTHTRTLHVVF